MSIFSGMIKKADMNIRQAAPFVAWLVLIFVNTGLSAQHTLINTSPDKEFYRARDLYEKQQYPAAREAFSCYMEEDGSNSELKSEAEYLHALCAVRLTNDDANELLLGFIENHPESPNLNAAWFELGRTACDRKFYGDAINWFGKVDRYLLSEEDQAEYFFKLGYSYFQHEDYERARATLYEIINKDTRFTAPAIYYYSHIAYEQKNYEIALQGFMKLRDDETFESLVPYYISHIYYLQKKWDQLIGYAPQYLEGISEKRYPEMARIIGEGYYNMGRYKEAIFYLDKYHQQATYTSPEDNYELGFAYYMTEDFKQAMDYFKAVPPGKNELSQSALYHLGCCFLKLNDRNQARLAFASAASMDDNKKTKQDALFNQAVVSYELSYSPFNEVINAFEKYISLYPASDRTDEAYNYLVMAYMTTDNYRAALASIEKIKRKDQNIERAYQRVAYFRGLELFNDLRFDEAIEKFDLSLGYNRYDRTIAALCNYWKGESYYRLGDYDRAITGYNDFMTADGAFETDVYVLCNYNLAYSWFKKNEYKQALAWFRKYVELEKDKSSRTLCDAYNRLGDLYFLDAKYEQAIGYYDQAISMGLVDTDYALYQKGVSLGVMGNYRQKIEVLGQMIQKWPGSAYMADALYETGRSYFILKEPTRSLPYYERIITNYPGSVYVRKTLVDLGLINYNQNRNDTALVYYKKAVAEFPGTAEADDALLGIKNVYIDMNRIDDYVEYVKSLGQAADVSAAEQDSLTYTAAENVYVQGDCETSKKNFEQYIQKFPAGKFLLSAHFYKAECNVKANELSQALKSYNFIILQPHSTFTEPALLAASRINFRYLKDYQAALDDYTRLKGVAEVKANIQEARIGIMRCYVLLNDHEKTIDAAREVLTDDKLSEEIQREAHYDIAGAFYELGRFALAQEEYMEVAKEVKSLEGAESKYRVAEIWYIRKDYKKAADVIFEFVDQNTPHQYWMAKAFLLLSDVYLAQGDDFQAGATLQSIIDYYEESNDGILDLAKRKKLDIDNSMREKQEKPAGEHDSVPGGQQNNGEAAGSPAISPVIKS